MLRSSPEPLQFVIGYAVRFDEQLSAQGEMIGLGFYFQTFQFEHGHNGHEHAKKMGPDLTFVSNVRPDPNNTVYGTRMKNPLVKLTETILHQLPPSSRFGEDDAAVVLCHQPLLLALEDDLVQGFYDTVYAHEPLRVVMGADERNVRELTLRQWWRRTVTGPFDERYWTWQVLVGLVHVKRGVKNPMMMGMWGFLLAWLRGRLVH